MKKNILIFALLIFSISHSQIQTVFYVDDVKVIDYVTVNFCVNDSARISQVSVLKEQTTYKNEVIIDRLVKYLKRVQYYPDSKLKNNCYDSTFKFVNKDYENAELKPSDYAKCKAFKTGDFTYSDFRHKGTKITRRKRKQREKNRVRKKEDWFKEKYRITWPSPCEYELEYLTVNHKSKDSLIGESIKVKIIALTNNGYVYKSKLLDFPEIISVIVFDDE